jgi:hypothetical protein
MANKVQAATLATKAGSALSSSYAAINANGLPEPCFLIRITNTTSGVVTISYDGSTDHDIIPANGFIEIDAQTNAQPPAWFTLFAKYQVVYVKGSSGSGNVYLSAYYVQP